MRLARHLFWRWFSQRTRMRLLTEYMEHRFGKLSGERWITVVPHRSLHIMTVSATHITRDEVKRGDMFTVNVNGDTELKMIVRRGGRNVRAA